MKHISEHLVNFDSYMGTITLTIGSKMNILGISVPLQCGL